MHAVKEALAEREPEGGIVRGGAIVTAAHDAATGGDAPHTGAATFEIDADANGVSSCQRGATTRAGVASPTVLCARCVARQCGSLQTPCRCMV